MISHRVTHTSYRLKLDFFYRYTILSWLLNIMLCFVVIWYDLVLQMHQKQLGNTEARGI